MSKPTSWIGAVALCLGLLTAGPHAVASVDAAARKVKPHLWHVTIGVNFFYSGIEVNTFFPEALAIHAGDSVQWTNQYRFRPQTVTFGPILNTPSLFLQKNGAEINPLVARPRGGKVVGNDATAVYSSGALVGNVPGLSESYTFRFPSTGRYLYRSLFHPGTSAEIDVVPAGAPVSSDPPDTGASYYDALRSVDKVVASEQPAERDGASNGGSSTTIDIGGGDNNVSLAKFSPAGVTVKAGSTITWQIKEMNGDPHDLYFYTLGGQSATYTKLAADGGLLLNPQFTKITLPSGTVVTTGTVKPGVIVNSGILYNGSVNSPSATPSTYSLTFDVPGRYTYIDPFVANGINNIDVTP